MQPWSLTRNTYLDKYMLVGQRSDLYPANPVGVWYQLSDDLINWSEPQLLVNAPNRDTVPDGQACLDGITYSVIIDRDDPAKDWTTADTGGNPNFDHPGATPDLYFNQTDRPATPAVAPCGTGSGGNLARMPIDFRWQRRATMQNGLIDPAYGSDSLPAGIDFTLESEADYDTSGPDRFALARTSVNVGPTPAWSYGRVNTTGWKNGDDVWYGAAFNLPTTFPTDNNGNVTILRRWGSTGSGDIVKLAGANDYRLVRSTPTGTTTISPPFKLPVGRWTWLEVHQKLGSSSGEEKINEVFVDGRLVASSTDANRDAADTQPVT